MWVNVHPTEHNDPRLLLRCGWSDTTRYGITTSRPHPKFDSLAAMLICPPFLKPSISSAARITAFSGWHV